MRVFIYISLAILLSGCASVQRYNEYFINETGSYYEWSESTYIESKVSIKVRLKLKYVKVKYHDHTEKYDIESYKYIYPKYTIFKFRSDRTGIFIVCTNGNYLNIRYDDSAIISIPSDDNDDLTKRKIYFNIDLDTE